MKYFLDSSLLIALINNNDALHSEAIKYKELIKDNDCYISNLIINEVVTVIGNKLTLDISIKTYNLLNNLFIVINEYEYNNFNSNTMRIYEKYNTKLSFTDSAIINIMKEANIENLISIDKEFKKEKGIKLIGLK